MENNVGKLCSFSNAKNDEEKALYKIVAIKIKTDNVKYYRIVNYEKLDLYGRFVTEDDIIILT